MHYNTRRYDMKGLAALLGTTEASLDDNTDSLGDLEVPRLRRWVG